MASKKLWGASSILVPLSDETIELLLAEFEEVFGRAEDGK